MPDHFVKSFFHEDAKIRPSDCLKVQIDPKTFIYKDLLPNYAVGRAETSSYL